MDLFKLVGEIWIKNQEANHALDETSNKGQKTQSKLSKAFSAMGKGAVWAGKQIGKGLLAGGAAMGALTVKALNLSGELEQNMGGAEAVFKALGSSIGEMSTPVQVFNASTGMMEEKIMSLEDVAQNAFSTMGLSTSDYLATVNKMGALFQGAGFKTQEALDMSSSAMQRAADVASIMGIDVESAMEAVAGAAKGNFTMMDNLGVAMNETTLAAYALSKGYKKTYDNMTQQEKIGVAMAMFMDKTAYAAGNYAKENETLAGSLGTAKAALTNFLDGSGDVEQLVSAFSSAADVIVRNITELAPRLVSGITDIINQVTPMLPPLLEQLLPAVIEGAIALVNGLVTAMPQIVSALMAALPALIDGFMMLFTALVTSLPQIIQPLLEALPTIITQLVNGLISNLPALVAGVTQLVVGIVSALPQITMSLIKAIPAVIKSVVQALFGALPILWEGITNIFSQITQGISNFFAPVREAISNAWAAMGNVPGLSSLKTMIEQVWGAIREYIGVVVNAIKNVVTTVWNSIKNVVSTVVNGIKNVISTVWESIKTIISNVMGLISSILKGDWEGVKNAVSNIINAIKNVISSVFNAIRSVISSVMNGIRNVITSIWQGIVNIVTARINAILSIASSVFNGLRNTISAVFSGISSIASSAWEGIKNAITNPIETAKNVVKRIIDTIKGFFNFNISWPKIPMPHFSITPQGWRIGDLLKGSIPKLGIEWYAKAMDNPMVMTDPTIFGYNPATGSLMGGGEAGSEMVGGTNAIMTMIGNAVAANSAEQNDRIVAVLSDILNAILGGNADMLRAMLADKTFKVGEREFARLVKEYA